jgi:hypothetical protein
MRAGLENRPAMEQLLHPDFTVTSPDDDWINRVTYFERCWPGHENIKRSPCRTSAPTLKAP